jgi:thiol:disulfide interchange protein DsbD
MYSSSSRALALLLLLCLSAGVAAAGLFDSPLNQAAVEPPVVSVYLKLIEGEPQAGAAVTLGVVYDLPEGVHMTTTFQAIRFGSESAAVFGTPIFPKPVQAEIPYYHGDVMALVPVSLPDQVGALPLTVVAEYQLCKEGDAALCFPPQEATATLTLELTADDDVAADAGEGPMGLQARLQAALESGSWLAFLLVFLGGVLASFTPCVYPMIPITISYIGGNAQGKPAKGFVLSLWYVLGIALVYSVLGLMAAATGGAFGQATQTPLFAGVVAAVIGAMALSMAGLFDIQMPSSLTSRIGGAKTGFLGPLIMGAAMGLIAAPCVGPILIVVLTWVATTGNLVLGFWLLFTFALGLGMLFLALGTFSGLLTALPGAGGWMNTVKHVFAVVLYALALSFLRLYVPGWLLVAALGAALFLSASAWGVHETLPAGGGARAGLGRGVLRFVFILGVMLSILGGLRGLAPGLLPAAGTGAAAESVRAEPAWVHDEAEGFALAAATGRPVMMDFWAEWCAACLELDHQTYNRPEILELAERFVSIKMDMTARTPENAARTSRFRTIGMPTVIFFDSAGNELERFSGFRSAQDLAEIMRRVLD